ncbi:FkbM family methyltransferase [Desulfonatronum lacustre]|uniref:FkbM family methyltransferase n=1 Tax=Desulfonatronum lacustre TaxID=66849 RepID=UPI0004AFE16E|nr:FkbM family methyltransferase [Desulfonatronum lacustre]
MPRKKSHPGKAQATHPLAPALAAFNKGNLEQAEQLVRDILRQKPQFPKALDILGTVLLGQKRNKEAVAPLEEACRLIPNDSDVWDHLGIAYMRAKEHAKAAQAFARCLELTPERASALNNAGYNLQHLKDYNQSELLIRKAIQLKPDYPEAHTNLAITLSRLGRRKEAEEFFQKALVLNPNSAETWSSLGTMYKEQDQPQKALKHFKKAVELDPKHAGAWNNLGVLLKEAGKATEAIRCFNKALDAKPDYAKAHNNLGGSYKDLNMPAKGIEHFRKSLELEPEYVESHSNMVFCLNYLSEVSREKLFAEHSEYNTRQASRVLPLPEDLQRDRDAQRTLHLGFVSGDLRNHSVSFFLRPVLEHLNRGKFEIHCYYNNTKWDETTDAFKALSAGWTDCKELSSQELANKIRQDNIDILFDLSGHTGGQQMLTFAAKPAPIQVNWIGYPNTTGLDAMDYRFVDAVTDPVDEADRFHTEELIRLPHGFLCYRPPISEQELPVAASPFTRNGHVTFGSFNNLAKVSPENIKMWAGVLNALPESKLLLKSLFVADAKAWTNIVARLRDEGVDPKRVGILQRTPSQKDHLSLYNRVDIALDTFPYHGTTTTCEALFMGVPVVTLAGDRHASRVSASLLARIGLDDLVAGSLDEYVRIAVDLAKDTSRLSRLRSEIRPRLNMSPLRDEPEFTRTVEKALRKMWEIYCAGEEPRVFEVTSDKQYDFSGTIPIPAQQPSITVPSPEQKPMPTPRNTYWDIKIQGDISVRVPGDIKLMTPYVLLEQEDWFEDEIHFVRQLIKPGMTCLDIGANHGVYALTIAKLLHGEGKVLAFEPAKAPGDMLEQSIPQNGLQDVLTLIRAGMSDHEGEAQLSISANSELNTLHGDGPKETIQLVTLDSLLEGDLLQPNKPHKPNKPKEPKIDFIKLDAEGEEINVLKGGGKFFAQHSPLVMFEIKHGNTHNHGLVQAFKGLGMDIYRLIPGLCALVPFDEEKPMDGYLLNLFACRKDRVQTLRESGFLVDGPDTSAIRITKKWQDVLESRPYAQSLFKNWKAAGMRNDDPFWGKYEEALDSYLSGMDQTLPPAERLVLLNKSRETFADLSAKGDSHVGTSLGLIRVLSDLGERQEAVKLTSQLVQAMGKGLQITLNRPFLPPINTFDDRQVQGDLGKWLQAAIFEALEKRRADSSFHKPQEHTQILSQLQKNPNHSIEMERRLALCALRFGKKIEISAESALCRETESHKNAWFWQKMAAGLNVVQRNEKDLSNIKLHIGGKEPKNGWKILNILPGENVDFVGDVKDLSLFSDESCSEIYASHVLEHVSQRDMVKTLQGIHRILQPGGKLMISVPDLDVLCRHFVDPKLNREQRFHIMRMMFGGQVDNYDFHYIGLNFEILQMYLQQAAFKRIERVKEFGLFNDTSSFKPYGELISLNVVALKSGMNLKKQVSGNDQGQVRSGQVRSGQVRSGQVRSTMAFHIMSTPPVVSNNTIHPSQQIKHVKFLK